MAGTNTGENIRTVEVEGITVHVDTVKTGSWEAFKLLRKARQAEDELSQFDVMVELMAYATDQSEETVVGHLGGEAAQMVDVVRIVSQIVSECYPKN